MLSRRFETILVVLFLSMLGMSGCSGYFGQVGLQHEDSIIVETTIAVVNADMGVEIDGERQNYSAAIIDTLDADFVLVSPAMAETGFDSGAYGAVLTFPSDVSEKILSFNAQHPERVYLDFKVNPNLAEMDYIDTFVKIMNLQLSINSTLAYTYVSSIIMQFHEAQDHLEAVFRNNFSNLAAVDLVRLPEFSSALDLDDIPDIPFDPLSVEIEHLMGGVTGFAESVSSVYLSSYASASSQYISMRDGMFRLIDNLENQETDWIAKMAAWASVIYNYGDALSQYNVSALLNWHALAIQWQIDAIAWHLATTSSLVLALLNLFDSDLYPALNDLKDIQANHGHLADWRNRLAIYVADVDACTTCALCAVCDAKPIPQLYTNFQMPHASDILAIYQLIDDIMNNNPTAQWPAVPANTPIGPPPPFDSTMVPASLPVRPTAAEMVPPDLGDYWVSVLTLKYQLSEFDVSEFLSESELEQVSRLLVSYEFYLELISADLELQFDLSLLELEEVRRGYIEYLAALREEILRGEAYSQERLRENLGEVITIKEGNIEDTLYLLSDFAGMMPESRREEGINQELVEFTVTPLYFIYSGVRTALTTIDAGIERLLAGNQLILIIIVVIALIMLAAITYYSYQRRRKWEEE